MIVVEPLSTSPPPLIQKSRIGSEVSGTIASEIDSLNYEPAESSEDFYVDMGMYITC